MNKVIFIGHLTNDPEVRYTQDEKQMAICRFSLAVNRKFKRDGEPSADFFNCVAFAKTGEFIEKYFSKGSKAAVIGHLQNNNYTNKNGEKVYSLQIIVDEVEFAGNSKSNATSTDAESSYDDEAMKQPKVGSDGFIDVDGIEEELPF